MVIGAAETNTGKKNAREQRVSEKVFRKAWLPGHLNFFRRLARWGLERM